MLRCRWSRIPLEARFPKENGGADPALEPRDIHLTRAFIPTFDGCYKYAVGLTALPPLP